MTLNASGKIRLGSNTAGESVNLELGNSASTQISMNSAKIRALTGTASGSQIRMPTDFYGKTYTPYLSTFFPLGSVATVGGGYPVGGFSDGAYASSSTKRLFLSGQYASSASANGPLVINSNLLGAPQWQLQLISPNAGYTATSGSGGYSSDSCVDSSGNYYFPTGDIQDNTSPRDYNAGVTKVNANGTVAWTYMFAFGTARTFEHSVTMNNAGDLIVACYSSASPSITIAKVNTSGTLIWKKSITGSSGRPAKIKFDSSDNIYFTANQGYDVTINKLNTDGDLRWSYKISNTSANLSPNPIYTSPCVGVASDGSVYVGSVTGYGYYGYTATGSVMSLLHLDTNGTILNYATFNHSDYFQTGSVIGILFDQSGNLLIHAKEYRQGGVPAILDNGNDDVIYKLDTSFNVLWARQWRRDLTYPYTGFTITRIIQVNNTIGWIGAGATEQTTYNGGIFQSPLYFQMPGDGSLTGTRSFWNVGTRHSSQYYSISPTAYTNSYTLSGTTIGSTNSSLTWTSRPLNSTSLSLSYVTLDQT